MLLLLLNAPLEIRKIDPIISKYTKCFKLLKIINLDYKVIHNKNWKKICDWALEKTKKNKSCALVVPREFLD